MDPVSCYSGSSYAERPTSLIWQDQRFEISKIISGDLYPEKKRFTVQIVTGEYFLLEYNFFIDQWVIIPL
jgi:hypothetical protein